jgi:hypothetical protein
MSNILITDINELRMIKLNKVSQTNLLGGRECTATVTVSCNDNGCMTTQSNVVCKD